MVTGTPDRITWKSVYFSICSSGCVMLVVACVNIFYLFNFSLQHIHVSNVRFFLHLYRHVNEVNKWFTCCLLQKSFLISFQFYCIYLYLLLSIYLSIHPRIPKRKPKTDFQNWILELITLVLAPNTESYRPHLDWRHWLVIYNKKNLLSTGTCMCSGRHVFF